MPFNPSVTGSSGSGPFYPNPQYFLGSLSTDPTNSTSGQWWYNTTTNQIKENINGTIVILSGTTPVKTDSNGNILSNITAQSIDPTVNQIGYPSSSYYLGSVSSDPTSSTSGQWWYNATTMQLKENINGSIQILGAFANSFSATTFITSNTTIGGSGITVNYVDLVVTNNATLTIAAGSTVNVADVVSITAGSSVVMQGATLNVYNALQNFGTLQSTSSSDSIQAVQVKNTGTMEIAGTLYLQSAGYNHLLAGILSGTGTLNIQGSAITLIGDSLNLSVANVTGSGTYQIQQNGTCNINGNIPFSIATVSGAGTLTINSGYTLTVNSNTSFSIATVSGAGTLTVNSGITLTVNGNTSFSISTVTGAGTLSIASGYTLTQSGNIVISVSNINISGTWANAGYGITVPSGDIVTWNVSGSMTTGTTAGTLTVNGTCYWIGHGITALTSNAEISFLLTLSGTGIFIGSPTGTGTATATISLSSTALAQNGGSSAATSSGGYPYFSLTSISGSAVGKYSIGNYNPTASVTAIYVLIYIGTASSSYTVSGYFGNGTSDISGDSINVYNTTGSAGTITLSGTAHV
jgi:hypothetical protein